MQEKPYLIGRVLRGHASSCARKLLFLVSGGRGAGANDQRCTVLRNVETKRRLSLGAVSAPATALVPICSIDFARRAGSTFVTLCTAWVGGIIHPLIFTSLPVG